MLQSYFYDGQLRRFINQFIRAISGFQVEFGNDRNGNRTLQRVPVFYGDSSRQALAIIQNNSENTMPVVPAMSVYISNLSYDRSRVQSPDFVSKMHIHQRAYNEETASYENRPGTAFTVERLMPVPHLLELKVDLWTSNTEQKLQLFEQMTTYFNPAMELQSTDNYIDWGSLTMVMRTNNNWSSRTVPIGTENPIDIATFTFELPIWISSPAKIKKLGIIQKIVTNIHDNNGDLSSDVYNDALLLGNRQYLTPLNYGVLLIGNTLTLLKVQDIESPREPTLNDSNKIGTKDNWHTLVGLYGELTNGISQIRLLLDDEVTEVVGTVSYHPTDESVLLFNADIDTYPSNSLQPIHAIIDPRKNSAVDKILSARVGTRYLILNAIGDFTTDPGNGASIWRNSNGDNFIANANDIIEYDGDNWFVSFNSAVETSLQYISNLNTGTQYKWNSTNWVKSFEGEYKGGLWALVL